MNREVAYTSFATVKFMIVVLVVYEQMEKRAAPQWVMVCVVALLCVMGLAVARIVSDQWERK